ncbi:MAG: hypothetical protein Q9213_005784 [Squamulea squamosa]
MSSKWSPRSLLIALSASFQFASSVLGKCECGYSVKGQGTYTDAFEADFFRQDDIAHDDNWIISRHTQYYPDTYDMSYNLQNVISNPLTRSSGDPGLQLFVRGPTVKPAAVSTAELITKRVDMHYGSYRAAIKYTTVPGTCGSMFWWKNETQEIDVELLSYQDTDSLPGYDVHLVLHGELDGQHRSAWDTPKVPFRPSDGYHEYRFDWSPGKVSYYIDGKHVTDLTESVPTVPGRILLNHWSHGQTGWEHGPPEKDALMTVAYVKAYFNTTSPAARCIDPQAGGAICEVPDQLGPVSPDKPTTFLTNIGTSSGDTVPVNPTTTSTMKPASTTSSGKISPENKCGGDEGFTCLNGPKVVATLVIAVTAVSQLSASVALGQRVSLHGGVLVDIIEGGFARVQFHRSTAVLVG